MNIVEISNIALSSIGITTGISALTETTKEARMCNRFYPIVRDAVLEAFDWDFARKRIVLSLLSTTYTGWDYAYAMPSDCIKIRKFITDADMSDIIQPKTEYEVAVNAALNAQIILTNEETAEITYTAKVTDPNLFSSLFVTAVAAKLAAEIAIPLRGLTKLKADMNNDYMRLIASASSSNANQGNVTRTNESDFTRARG